MGHSSEAAGSSEDKMVVMRYDLGYDWDEEDTDVKEEPAGLTFGAVFDISASRGFSFFVPSLFWEREKRKKSPENYIKRRSGGDESEDTAEGRNIP